MSVDIASSFLKNLFSTVRNTKLFITQLPYGNQALTDANNPQIHGKITDGQWFFGACPRDRSGAVIGLSHIWVDLDGVTDPPNGVFVAPPSTLVLSGHGLHLYYMLTELIPIDVGIRMTKLASLAFDSDTSVCEPHRIMRLPGSLNQKYKIDVKECKVAASSWVQYSPQDIEERLMAAILVPYWITGQRHQTALATSALLSRATWEEDRVYNVFQHVCSITNDTELNDRIDAAKSTFNRIYNGDLVSSSLLRDALDKDFKRLIEALNITGRDGDLIFNGEVFGKSFFLEKSLTHLALSNLNDWKYAEGIPSQWTGTHWKHYDDDVLRRQIYVLFNQVKEVQSGEETEFDAVIKTASSVMQMVKGVMKTSPLDSPREDIIPLLNCVIDTSDMSIRDHKPSDNNRFTLPIEYDESAIYPVWEKFLIESCNDVEVYNYIQEWLGYCLVLGNPKQKMMWIQGMSGTGKSTFLKIVEVLFGEAAVTISANDINQQTVASICSAHVALCAEISRRKLQTRTINRLVTGDAIDARFLYGRQFNAVFRGKIIWTSNTLPPVDEGEGFWRRLVTIPFNTVPTKIDDMLNVKLRDEIPGIFNWALEGLKRYLMYDKLGRWPIPSVAKNMLFIYRESAEIMEQFRDECLEMNPNGVLTSQELYIAYRNWVESVGHRALPLDSNFYNEMKRIGLERTMTPIRVGKVLKRGWIGAKLKSIMFSTSNP